MEHDAVTQIYVLGQAISGLIVKLHQKGLLPVSDVIESIDHSVLTSPSHDALPQEFDVALRDFLATLQQYERNMPPFQSRVPPPSPAPPPSVPPHPPQV